MIKVSVVQDPSPLLAELREKLSLRAVFIQSILEMDELKISLQNLLIQLEAL